MALRNATLTFSMNVPEKRNPQHLDHRAVTLLIPRLSRTLSLSEMSTQVTHLERSPGSRDFDGESGQVTDRES